MASTTLEGTRANVGRTKRKVQHKGLGKKGYRIEVDTKAATYDSYDHLNVRNRAWLEQRLKEIEKLKNQRLRDNRKETVSAHRELHKLKAGTVKKLRYRGQENASNRFPVMNTTGRNAGSNGIGFHIAAGISEYKKNGEKYLIQNIRALGDLPQITLDLQKLRSSVNEKNYNKLVETRKRANEMLRRVSDVSINTDVTEQSVHEISDVDKEIGERNSPSNTDSKEEEYTHRRTPTPLPTALLKGTHHRIKIKPLERRLPSLVNLVQRDVSPSTAIRPGSKFNRRDDKGSHVVNPFFALEGPALSSIDENKVSKSKRKHIGNKGNGVLTESADQGVRQREIYLKGASSKVSATIQTPLLPRRAEKVSPVLASRRTTPEKRSSSVSPLARYSSQSRLSAKSISSSVTRYSSPSNISQTSGRSYGMSSRHKKINFKSHKKDWRLPKRGSIVLDDVTHCRYIRHYEPPVMKMPTNPSQYVFHSNSDGESLGLKVQLAYLNCPSSVRHRAKGQTKQAPWY